MAIARRQPEAMRRALAHPIRTQLLEALQARGPATLRQLASEDVRPAGPASVIGYHLDVLRRVGLVKREARGEQAARYML